MIYFADDNSGSIILALVGIVGAVITSLFALLNANTKALNKVAKSSDKVATATTKSAAEAKQRNGHLGDQNLKLAQLVTDQNRDMAEVKNNTAKTAELLSKSALIAAEDSDILTPNTQVVHEQTVEHQTVKEK